MEESEKQDGGGLFPGDHDNTYIDISKEATPPEIESFLQGMHRVGLYVNRRSAI